MYFHAQYRIFFDSLNQSTQDHSDLPGFSHNISQHLPNMPAPDSVHTDSWVSNRLQIGFDVFYSYAHQVLHSDPD